VILASNELLVSLAFRPVLGFAQQQVYSARSCKRGRSASVFSRAEIHDIAGRASTIDERRLGICVVEEPADEGTREQIRDRLTAWRDSAAAGDNALFARRLAADGLDERGARPANGRLPDIVSAACRGRTVSRNRWSARLTFDYDHSICEVPHIRLAAPWAIGFANLSLTQMRLVFKARLPVDPTQRSVVRGQRGVSN
jgi:hypothetical protein